MPGTLYDLSSAPRQCLTSMGVCKKSLFLMLQRSLWFQAEAGTSSEIMPLLCFFPSTPYKFLLGALEPLA